MTSSEHLLGKDKNFGLNTSGEKYSDKDQGPLDSSWIIHILRNSFKVKLRSTIRDQIYHLFHVNVELQIFFVLLRG